MREYFEQQLIPDVDGITVVFFEELADGTLARRETMHPEYDNLSSMAFLRWTRITGIEFPIFRRAV